MTTNTCTNTAHIQCIQFLMYNAYYISPKVATDVEVLVSYIQQDEHLRVCFVSLVG